MAAEATTSVNPGVSSESLRHRPNLHRLGMHWSHDVIINWEFNVTSFHPFAFQTLLVGLVQRK